ncbi:hypothetical protein T10_9294 [Trichinella papuae]|uniref:Uncharacterized protein n=1 Tax=Trichinella papuae TaxID=268474 RepID=A0A0V1M551_9BILA|nr:hypothetical protein T10_9294 [Trichinella papuae]
MTTNKKQKSVGDVLAMKTYYYYYYAYQHLNSLKLNIGLVNSNRYIGRPRILRRLPMDDSI